VWLWKQGHSSLRSAKLATIAGSIEPKRSLGHVAQLLRTFPAASDTIGTDYTR
jgi:hypothetical protein